MRTEDGEIPLLVTNRSLDVTGRGGPRRAGPLTHTVSPCTEALLLIHVSTVTGKQTVWTRQPAVRMPRSLSQLLHFLHVPPLQGDQLAQGFLRRKYNRGQDSPCGRRAGIMGLYGPCFLCSWQLRSHTNHRTSCGLHC